MKDAQNFGEDQKTFIFDIHVHLRTFCQKSQFSPKSLLGSQVFRNSADIHGHERSQCLENVARKLKSKINHLTLNSMLSCETFVVFHTQRLYNNSIKLSEKWKFFDIF